MRIVSICPSNTEILYYLGLHEHVVGLDDHSDWPPEWQHLPRVGPDLSIDMERVVALQPDLVVASLSVPGMEKNVEALRERGIPHIVLNPSRIGEIAADIRLVGEATGFHKQAEQLAASFDERIESIRQQTAAFSRRPKLYWEWWPNPIYTPGRENWLTDVSEIAGAVNVFADFPVANVKATREMVQERDPDHICVVWCGIELRRIKPETITSRPEWSDMTAIRQGQVHLLEEGLYCRPSPRILDGLEQLVKLIHT
ncbi:cobalamin-binding protein [Brevibacillus agri]|uniref:Cobalamin-binding protein n=1 Tax=Brevibacillus agri TaxID=51101 RepID=A0A3M8BFK4_9BACL|nr:MULTISPECIES: cobalamin-binding protein [Brevibacillus]EJL40698.1 ABC-type Fe3+-hydroxamate transport system, periplasmic component [Brevibacillus sp. CF112]MBY0050618.1 cobalamin-binding protein [Brevibacillus agri]MCG5251890.1 cobalamin-binding protein [Brevibacillus agri]MDN4094015.1 cobalamin-binding protein [Brevibacillus agri]MDR9504273.1 cobalamin-binding protein [Brevibacillus agri]